VTTDMVPDAVALVPAQQTRSVGGCTTSAEPVTWRGVERPHTSPCRSNATRATSARSASLLGR
jgi:hypothetical protein